MKNLMYLFILGFIFSCSDVGINEQRLESQNFDKASVYKILSKNENRVIKDDLPLKKESDCEGYVVQAYDCNEIIPITELVQVPPYCNFVQVSYSLQVCNDAHENLPVIFIITNFTAIPLEGPDELGCSDFIEKLKSLPFQRRVEAFEEFEYAASLVVELALATDWATVIVDGTLQANFFRDLCYQWIPEIKNESGFVQIEMEKLLCGTQCCLRETIYKVDHGNLTPSESIFRTIGECEQTSQGDNPDLIRNCTDNECGPIE